MHPAAVVLKLPYLSLIVCGSHFGCVLSQGPVRRSMRWHAIPKFSPSTPATMWAPCCLSYLRLRYDLGSVIMEIRRKTLEFHNCFPTNPRNAVSRSMKAKSSLTTIAKGIVLSLRSLQRYVCSGVIMPAVPAARPQKNSRGENLGYDGVAFSIQDMASPYRWSVASD